MGNSSVERSCLIVDGDTLYIAASLLGAAEEEGIDELWLVEFDLVLLKRSFGGIDFVSEAIDGCVWSIDLAGLGVPPGSGFYNDGGGVHLSLGRKVEKQVARVGAVAKLEAIASLAEVGT